MSLQGDQYSGDPPRDEGDREDNSHIEKAARKVVRFTELALCGDEVWIEYEGKLYRLQSTRQGKLVLTK